MSYITRYFWGEYGMDKDPYGDYVDAEEYDHLTAQLAERDAKIKYFAEQSLKAVKDLKYLNGCVARGRGGDISADYMRDNVFLYIKELEQENTTLRAKLAECEEEVGRLKAEVDNIKQVEFPRRVEKLRTDIRKQTAQECVNICNNMEGSWADLEWNQVCQDIAKAIVKRYGLEG